MAIGLGESDLALAWEQAVLKFLMWLGERGGLGLYKCGGAVLLVWVWHSHCKEVPFHVTSLFLLTAAVYQSRLGLNFWP